MSEQAGWFNKMLTPSAKENPEKEKEKAVTKEKFHEEINESIENIGIKEKFLIKLSSFKFQVKIAFFIFIIIPLIIAIVLEYQVLVEDISIDFGIKEFILQEVLISLQKLYTFITNYIYMFFLPEYIFELLVGKSIEAITQSKIVYFLISLVFFLSINLYLSSIIKNKDLREKRIKTEKDIVKASESLNNMDIKKRGDASKSFISKLQDLMKDVNIKNDDDWSLNITNLSSIYKRTFEYKDAMGGNIIAAKTNDLYQRRAREQIRIKNNEELIKFLITDRFDDKEQSFIVKQIKIPSLKEQTISEYLKELKLYHNNSIEYSKQKKNLFKILFVITFYSNLSMTIVNRYLSIFKIQFTTEEKMFINKSRKIIESAKNNFNEQPLLPMPLLFPRFKDESNRREFITRYKKLLHQNKIMYNKVDEAAIKLSTQGMSIAALEYEESIMEFITMQADYLSEMIILILSDNGYAESEIKDREEIIIEIIEVLFQKYNFNQEILTNIIIGDESIEDTPISLNEKFTKVKPVDIGFILSIYFKKEGIYEKSFYSPMFIYYFEELNIYEIFKQYN